VSIGIVVQGYCPMGCGRTLRLSSSGLVVCFDRNCPRPNAVSDLLQDNETEHIVWMNDERWLVRHPLWERIVGRMDSCTLTTDLNEMGPPESAGRWRAHKLDDGWKLQPIGNVD
jgi:Family of unknown function (DUF6085)